MKNTLSLNHSQRIERIKWIVIISLASLWLVFTATYSIWFVAIPAGASKSFETTKFVFLSISAFGVLITSLLSSFNSLEASFNIQDKLRFDKIENSFSYMSQWDSDMLKEARHLIRAIGKEEHLLSSKELCERIAGDKELERSIINTFNFFEEIYLSIQAGRVDEPLLKSAFQIAFQVIYKRFYPWYKDNINDTTQFHTDSLQKLWIP